MDNDDVINLVRQAVTSFDKESEKLKKILATLEKTTSEEEQINEPTREIDMKSEEYIITLKFVNGLLKNMGRAQISDLTEFCNIPRNDIISEKQVKLLEDMTEEIFSVFNKVKCQYYNKSESWVFNVLKSMVKINGLNIISRYKTKYVNRTRVIYTVYTISI